MFLWIVVRHGSRPQCGFAQVEFLESVWVAGGVSCRSHRSASAACGEQWCVSHRRGPLGPVSVGRKPPFKNRFCLIILISLHIGTTKYKSSKFLNIIMICHENRHTNVILCIIFLCIIYGIKKNCFIAFFFLHCWLLRSL